MVVVLVVLLIINANCRYLFVNKPRERTGSARESRQRAKYPQARVRGAYDGGGERGRGRGRGETSPQRTLIEDCAADFPIGASRVALIRGKRQRNREEGKKEGIALSGLGAIGDERSFVKGSSRSGAGKERGSSPSAIGRARRASRKEYLKILGCVLGSRLSRGGNRSSESR